MITATTVDDVSANLIATQKVCADELKVHITVTSEFIYNIADKLITELDAEAKHMRSLGLFG